MKKDLRLPVDADLTFCSFVQAYQMLDDVIKGGPFMELQVPLSNYHQAFLLSLGSGVSVDIKDMNGDEWALEARWYDDKHEFNEARVWSPGA
jgi:hypothetical protein